MGARFDAHQTGGPMLGMFTVVFTLAVVIQMLVNLRKAQKEAEQERLKK